MGSLLYAVELGLINYLHAPNTQILDIIPVDYVSNLILATAAYTAESEPGTFNVVHSTTSGGNPISISEILRLIMKYLAVNPT
jgi:hypothetical protein